MAAVAPDVTIDDVLKVKVAKLSDDELVGYIAELTEALVEYRATVNAIESKRVEAFRHGREQRTPPVVQKRMADAAGITEGGVNAAIKADIRRRDGDG